VCEGEGGRSEWGLARSGREGCRFTQWGGRRDDYKITKGVSERSERGEERGGRGQRGSWRPGLGEAWRLRDSAWAAENPRERVGGRESGGGGGQGRHVRPPDSDIPGAGRRARLCLWRSLRPRGAVSHSQIRRRFVRFEKTRSAQSNRRAALRSRPHSTTRARAPVGHPPGK
jgi:hypothetical protein